MPRGLLTGEGLAVYHGAEMRIGLLSDTHIPVAAAALPDAIARTFRGVDLILHAGDIYIVSVLNELESIAPVLAARGDDDYRDTLADERVKQEHLMEIDGRKLRLVHERPYSYLSPLRQDIPLAGQDRDGTPDIVVFGHEHQVVVEHYGDILYVNPGSPTFLNYRYGLGTVAILNIDSHEVQVHVVEL